MQRAKYTPEFKEAAVRHLSIGVNLFKLTEPLLSNHLQLASTAYPKYRFHPACTALLSHTKGCHLYPTASANQARKAAKHMLSYLLPQLSAPRLCLH